ncbi:MAG: hypothetical protein K2O88_09915 [Paramuribaculum sp.]|nr:hypothetical protein [Paramuribaculum sp.]
MKKKIPRSTWLPIVLLAYLAVMSYMGRQELFQGNYLYYFGIIGSTLAIIIVLHFLLKYREKK